MVTDNITRSPSSSRLRAVDAAFILLSVALATPAFLYGSQIDTVLVLLGLVFIARIRHTLKTFQSADVFFVAALALFAVWSVLPSAPDFHSQLIGGLQFLRAILVYLLFRSLIVGQESFWRFVGIASVSAAAIVVLSLGELGLAQATDHEPLTFSGSRLTGPAANPNYFAHWLVILLGLNAGRLIWLYRPPEGGTTRSLRTQTRIFLVLTVGCVLTLSRGAWVATGLILLITLVLLARPVLRGGTAYTQQVKTFGVLLFLAVGVVSSVVLNPSWLTRGITLFTSTDVRYEVWPAALTWFSQASLSQQLLGVGAWQFEYYIPGIEISNAHNGYLSILVSYGLLGLGIFLGIILRVSATLYRRADPVRVSSLGLVGALVFAVSNDTLVVVHYWTLMALLLAGALSRARPANLHANH